jgi:hypothetical protein
MWIGFDTVEEEDKYIETEIKKIKDQIENDKPMPSLVDYDMLIDSIKKRKEYLLYYNICKIYTFVNAITNAQLNIDNEKNDDYINTNLKLYHDFDDNTKKYIDKHYPIVKIFHDMNINKNHVVEYYKICINNFDDIIKSNKEFNLIDLILDAKSYYNKFMNTINNEFKISINNDYPELFQCIFPMIDIFYTIKFTIKKIKDFILQSDKHNSNMSTYYYLAYAYYISLDENNVYKKFLDEHFKPSVFYTSAIFYAKLIDDKTINYTDEIKMKIAEIYVYNPNLINNINKFHNNIFAGFENLLDKSCDNIFIKIDPNKVHRHIENDITWCFAKSDWDKINDINPYTQKCIKNNNCKSNFYNDKDEYITLSDKAYTQLLYWSNEIYTRGLKFVKFDEEIAQEFSQTINKNKKYKLYRAMQFDDYDEFTKHVTLDSDTFSLTTDIYTSWTHEKNCANMFIASHHYDPETNIDTIKDDKLKESFLSKLNNPKLNELSTSKYKLIYSAEFTYNELLIDFTKIKNYMVYKHELEVIALPINAKKVSVEKIISDKNIYYNIETLQCKAQNNKYFDYTSSIYNPYYFNDINGYSITFTKDLFTDEKSEKFIKNFNTKQNNIRYDLLPEKYIKHDFETLKQYNQKFINNAHYLFPNSGIYSGKYITPMHYALLNNDIILLKYLLDNGVSNFDKIKTSSINDKVLSDTPFEFAKSHNSSQEILDIIK